MLVIAPLLTLVVLQALPPEGAPTALSLPPVRGAFLALGQPVRALAAARTAVAALTESGEVVVFDLEGRTRRRLGPAPAGGRDGRRRSAAAAPRRDGFAIGAGVLEDGDFNDPYDVDSDVEDPENLFLDESGGGGSRPRRGRLPVTGPTLVAAGGRSIWIATPGGLSRFDDDAFGGGAPDGERRTRSASGAAWGALSASTDGRWLAGAQDGWLVRSDDGGETFTTLAPVGEGPRRLAITDDGTVFVLERQGQGQGQGQGQVPIGGAGVGDRTHVVSISSDSAIDVAACGHRAVVLEAGRMRLIDADAADLTRREVGRAAGVIDGPPPGETTGVACASGDRVVAYGTGLWTLAGVGRGWSRRDDLPPALPILSAVVAGESVWVATDAGLWVVPVAPSVEAAAIPDVAGGAPPALSAQTSVMTATSLSPVESHAAWWAAALPRIELGFASARASDRSEVRAFVLLTFLLGEERGWVRERRRLAFEDAAWRRANLAMRASLAHPPPAGADPLDREERAALARILESIP